MGWLTLGWKVTECDVGTSITHTGSAEPLLGNGELGLGEVKGRSPRGGN